MTDDLLQYSPPHVGGTEQENKPHWHHSAAPTLDEVEQFHLKDQGGVPWDDTS